MRWEWTASECATIRNESVEDCRSDALLVRGFYQLISRITVILDSRRSIYLHNQEAVESVAIADAGQRLENEIAEHVRGAHIGLASFLVQESADEFLFVSVRSLEKTLILLKKLVDHAMRAS